MNKNDDVSTLVELLRHCAQHKPDGVAYMLLPDSEGEASRLTYGELQQKASVIAAHLRGVGATGERVLLLYPTSFEYITAFFGCMWAGAIPVPAYPPRANHPNPRIQAIVSDSQAKFALATAATVHEWPGISQHSPELSDVHLLDTTCLESSDGGVTGKDPLLTNDSTAYIQYTSGSTASPKGVVLSHGNLLSNLDQIQRAFAIDARSIGFSWLPLYHDMGLIGGVLLSMYVGKPLILLSPTAFAQNPYRWLQAITSYRVTVSAGPNFAYQLCVDRITPEEREKLDLSSWEVACCGAEPVRADTLNQFAEVFTPCGFRPEVFRPTYGLGEATLCVSIKNVPSRLSTCAVQRDALERGRVIACPVEDQTAISFVSCGQVLPEHQVAIVDPESCEQCLPDRVGEIWVSGPSVGQGYWKRAEDTLHTFQAFMAGTGEGPFLRTGDLGFVRDGELFITGRLKDLIIIRGLNYTTHDIEMTAERSHPALQPGSGAAFSMLVDSEERLVIVHELKRSHRKADTDEIARAIRHAVAEEQELPVYSVALMNPMTIPRTTSGKIQRSLCRAEFLAGRLKVIAISRLDDPQRIEASSLQDTLAAPRTHMEIAVAAIWSEVLSVEHVGIHDNFFELGGHSLAATQVISRLREVFQVEVSLRSLFEMPTVAGLATQVEETLRAGLALQTPPLQPISRNSSLPLSFFQERMWFLHQLDPESSAYNITGALRLLGPLDQIALERSLAEIARRHEALRTTFPTQGGQPVQLIAATSAVVLKIADFRDLPEEIRLDHALGSAQEEACRPFDLSRGPLVRACLLQLDDQEHILTISMHHIICDAWSMGVLTQEISKFYNAYASGESVDTPMPAIQYVDFAVWQRQWLQDEVLETHLAYWRTQLAGVQALELPVDRPRPVTQRHHGATTSIDVPKDLLEELKRLSNREGVTLFMALLTAFQILLHRYTGQEDIAVGVPIANRNWLGVEGMVGSFVNTLVMRADLSGDPTVHELFGQVREVALGAYTHQDMPFAKLVAELQPDRDTSRAPLFQVMFNTLNMEMPSLQLKGLSVTPLEVDVQGAQFDLTLTVTDTELQRRISLNYNTDLIEADTAGRMLGHFQNILRGIVQDSSQQISALPLLTAAERHQLMVAWNDTAADQPHFRCVAELFEAQVDRTPEAIAVTFADRSLTYAELDRQANQLAHYLRSLGVGPEVVVGLCVERSLEMVVGLWGILKAGGAYLPLDPANPCERLAYMLQDARAPVVLTQHALLERLPRDGMKVIALDRDRGQITQAPTTRPTAGVRSEHLAYVIYTSGSAGSPKGVLLEHRGLTNFVTAWKDIAGLRMGSQVSQILSYSFDGSIKELFPALLAGATLHLVSQDMVLQPEVLCEFLQERAITHLCMTPSMLTMLPAVALPALETIASGGEVCRPELAARWLLPGRRFVNVYGPTETTVAASTYTVTGPTDILTTIPIGRPLQNVQLYVLDEQRQPVPIGVPGELYIGGIGVARGYLGRTPLDAERFVPDSFGEIPGARLYRSGDRARYRSDGNIEFLGRLDQQVKIRGFRVELEEIEATLARHVAVDKAVVVCKDDFGEQRLVAYVVPAQEFKPNPSDLRQFLARTLPEYMLPAAFVTVENIPLTPSGKVDRAALPTPQWQRPELASEFSLPRTPIEEALLRTWTEVLRIARIGIHDNFFELGGHSLMATQVVSRVRDVFQVEVPLRSFFETPTIAGVAAHVEKALRAEETLQVPPLEPVRRDGPLPLSFSQERMWFLHQLDPESTAYNIVAALRLIGPLNREALERSLTEIVRRHEALRTTFTIADGRPVQIVTDVAALPLEILDLRGLDMSERQARAMKHVQEVAQLPFDLNRGPLARLCLLQIDDIEHILAICMHHIVTDAWSTGVLTREFTKFYNTYASGGSIDLPMPAIQYADFAVWQRQWLQGDALEMHLAYWREQLDNLQTLELATDYARPVMQRYHGASISIDMPQELLDDLKKLSGSEGVTPFMTLLAAFQILLHRYTGQQDIAVGVPIANRNWLAVEDTVGSFVNTLVMRTVLSDNPTVREIFQLVRNVALGAYAHQDMPFAKLVAELQPERDTSRAPLFQVMFNVVNVALPAVQLGELNVSPLDVDPRGAQFDLTLTVMDTELQQRVSLNYNTELFTSDSAGRMLDHYLNILRGMVQDPGQQISSLSMLTVAEYQQLVVTWNDTRCDYPEDATLVDLFAAQVDRTPEAIAVTYGKRTLTYAQLDQRANQVAHFLQSLGVGPEVIVGVMLERSIDAVVGLLGVLKAGGAYLPLDPSYPEERLAFMLVDAQAKVLLTRATMIEGLPQQDVTLVCLDTDRLSIDRQATSSPICGACADSLAYVLYTSGSTGRPKGVLGLHRGAVNRFAWMWNTYPFEADETCCQKTRLSFVDSVWEVFGPLLRGITTVIIQDEVVQDIHRLVEMLAKHHITRVVLVPSLLQAILDTHPDVGHRLPSLRIWVCSGEALSPELAFRFRQSVPWAKLLNLYGSSEVAADVAYYDTAQLHTDTPRVPIGRPIANTQIYVLDSYLNPVPVGVPGEIYVGGANLARGYVSDSELTVHRFVADPFSNDPTARLFRTGDLARYLMDGNIDYLGRRDHQVKIRGFRVELGEIETTLQQHSGVTQAAVVAKRGRRNASATASDGIQRLVACVVTDCGALSPKELRDFLASRLPDYMIPSGYLFLETLPLNPHGKIDYLALDELSEIYSDVASGFVAPRNELESKLIQILEDVLQCEGIGIHDNFFDLGGHSLLAVRLVTQIEEVIGIRLSVSVLFQSPTVEKLAEVILMSDQTANVELLVPIQTGGTAPPFFCVHGLGGGVMGYYDLARLLGSDQPFYGLRARGTYGEEQPHNHIEDMAANYLSAIYTVQPYGPYALGGYSYGGIVAFEMACQLHARGEQVALLALLDTYAPSMPTSQRHAYRVMLFLKSLRNLPLWVRDIVQRRGGISRLWARIYFAIKGSSRKGRDSDASRIRATAGDVVGDTASVSTNTYKVTDAHLQAMESYHPHIYPGRVTLFRVPGMRLLRAYDPGFGWGELSRDGVEIRMIDGAHYNILEQPQVQVLAAQLKDSLRQAFQGISEPTATAEGE